jgi:hypothetical protein
MLVSPASIFWMVRMFRSADGNWIQGPDDHDATSSHLMALSGVITAGGGGGTPGTVILFK